MTRVVWTITAFVTLVVIIPSLFPAVAARSGALAAFVVAGIWWKPIVAWLERMVE